MVKVSCHVLVLAAGRRASAVVMQHMRLVPNGAAAVEKFKLFSKGENEMSYA
eukprot:COSAG05_NODE_3873_length_1795_cov_52.030095_2_plen_51_part_01